MYFSFPWDDAVKNKSGFFPYMHTLICNFAIRWYIKEYIMLLFIDIFEQTFKMFASQPLDIPAHTVRPLTDVLKALTKDTFSGELS